MTKTMVGTIVFFLVCTIALMLGCQSKEVTSAKVYMQQDDWPKAIEQLEKAVELYPNDPEAHYLLGEGYAWKREWTKMNEMFEKSLAIGPKFEAQAKNTRERHWVNNFNSGVGKVNGGDVEGAIKSFSTCLIINPSKPEAYKNLAYTYIQQDSTLAAKQVYLSLLENVGEDVEAMSSLARLHLQDKEYEKALELEQKVLEKDPENTDAIANVALIYDFMGEAEKAFKAYEDALAKNPEDKDLIFNLGRLYFMKHDYDKAIEQFKKAIEKNPDDVDSNVNVGNAYLSMGDQFRQELKAKEEAGEEIAKEEMDKLKAFYCNSIPYYETALALRPNEDIMWNNIGVAYINCGEREKGEAAFRFADNTLNMAFNNSGDRIKKPTEEPTEKEPELPDIDTTPEEPELPGTEITPEEPVDTSLAKKPIVAVMELKGFDVPSSEVYLLTEALQNALVNSKKFKVIERLQIQNILKEQAFQQTGCVDDGCLVEVGQLLGADRIIGGSIHLLKGEVYSLNIRTIDLETGEIISSTDLRNGDILTILEKGMQFAVKKLIKG